MRPIRASRSAWIDGSPELVYAVLADYAGDHQRIVPRPFFESLVVERGGWGEGTRLRATTRLLGVRTTLRMEVSEPSPGRVLREEDGAAGVATTFSVAPERGGCRVEIATEWRPRPGLRGLVERLIQPPIARAVYRRELELLDDLVAWREPGLA